MIHRFLVLTVRPVAMVFALVALATGTAFGQDEADLGWSDAAELTLVFTGGNAEASTLGVRNTLARKWDGANLSIDVGALRGETSKITRVATGTSPVNFEVAKNSVSTLTAENYHARGRYDRDLNERLFWYAGTGWERNTFAGLDSRYSVGGGLGNTWVDDEASTFRTAYGVNYTLQDDVAKIPGGDDSFSFAALQVSYDFRRQVTPTTEFTSALIADENLDDTSDFRADLTNAVAVSMNSQLALKVSWQLRYDHQPSKFGLPLFLPSGVATGDTVFATLDTVDHVMTFALVATF